jgi:hypothetical protein
MFGRKTRLPWGGLQLVKRSTSPPSPFFRVGEKVPFTGMYRIFHAEHRTSHEVVLLKDQQFPRCSHCGTDVHFELLSKVPSLENDPDFKSRRLFEVPHPEVKEKKQTA